MTIEAYDRRPPMSGDRMNELIEGRRFTEAMALQAETVGVKPGSDVHALGMHTARELSPGDPRSHAYVFDLKNPVRVKTQAALAGERGFESYGALVSDSRDTSNANREQARAALRDLDETAEKRTIAELLPRIGRAEFRLAQAPDSGAAVVDVSAYLPDGDVAFARATDPLLEGLTELGYTAVVVDGGGKDDQSTSPSQLIRYAAEVMKPQQ